MLPQVWQRVGLGALNAGPASTAMLVLMVI